jgi:uncharacterized RDD family membrane protein YckC
VTSAPAPAYDDLRLADPDRRFHAFAIDRLLGWGTDAAVAVVVLHRLDHRVLAVVLIVGTVLLVGLVFATLLGSTGATPGMWLLGLRLVHTGTGRPIGFGPAVLRTFVLGLATLPCGFGLAALAWTAASDPGRLRRGWHDHLVGAILLDVRPEPAVPETEDTGPHDVVNLTALRLGPGRAVAEPPARVRREREPTRGVVRTARSWVLAFDHGERVVVDTLVLIGRQPAPRRGEQAARLVVVPSADRSVAAGHAQVVVAADGALVVTDRGSASGSTLVRQGVRRRLAPGRPTTLLDGDVVAIGDRSMRVHRLS